MRRFLKSLNQVFKENGILDFIRKGFNYILQNISVPFCKHRIKGFQPSTWPDALDFAYNRYFGLLKPAQVQSELKQLLQTVSNLKPKYTMEIGTLNGGTLFLFSRLADVDATLLSVDLPWGEFGYGYPKFKVPLYRTFVRPSQTLHLLRANSHERTTVEQVKKHLNNQLLDFLFLDGDHTYTGVKQDFEMYSPLVRKGGFIGFHDIVPHPPETGCDVYRFWNELKDAYPDRIQEFVEDWGQEWAGIGLFNV